MKNRDTFPIQLLGLGMITVDQALQSRESTSLEFQREFSESMLRGDEFPPIIVFFDGEKYWLADGFHRYGARKILARKDPKFENIRAEIHQGSRRDAIIYSAGSNKKFSIPRSDADRKKSLRMLLNDPEWFSKPVGTISSYLGISPIAIQKWRKEYCDENGIEEPKRDRIVGKQVSRVYSNGQGAFVCSVHGKMKYLGMDEKAAQKKRDQIAKEQEAIGNSRRRKVVSALSDMYKWLFHRGVITKGVGNAPMSGLGQAFAAENTMYVVANFEEGDKVTEVVGRLLLNRRRHNPEARMAVACDKVPNLKVVEVAREMGIQFVNPEELLELIQESSLTFV